MWRHWLFSWNLSPARDKILHWQWCYRCVITYDTYSQVSLPTVTVVLFARAGRRNFQYLILAGPPNCDRQIIFLPPFPSLPSLHTLSDLYVTEPLADSKAPNVFNMPYAYHFEMPLIWSCRRPFFFSSMHWLRKFIRVESLFKLVQWSWYLGFPGDRVHLVYRSLLTALTQWPPLRWICL